MNGRHGRFAWLGLVSAIACGTGQVGVEDQVALSITSPVDGAVVRRGDDVNGAAGIQVDVVVKVDGVLEGTEILLHTSANPIGLDSAFVENGEARFSAFTLPRGELTLHAATATCNTATCFASIALTVVDSDTVVSIAKPTEGEAVPLSDVELSVVRESGAPPQGCRVDVDGRGIGNFTWTNQAQPLSVFSSLPAGPHTVQAFCNEGLDTIPTQLVSFTVGGIVPLTPSLTISPPGPSVLNGDSDADVVTPGFQTAIAVDATGLDGASVVICASVDPGAGEACGSGGFVVGRGEVSAGVAVVLVTLGQGVTALSAEYVNADGTISVSPRVAYAVDAVGPTIALGVRTAAGSVQGCGATACLADTRDLAAGRIGLDRTATDSICGFGSCSALGTELFFALTECVNSDASLETCPISVRLQSRRVGDSAWADVFNGVFASGETLDAAVLTDPRFDPGTTRELRLVTQDSNGNPAVSNSVILTLDFSGARIESVERLTAALAPTGDALTDDRYYGIAESIVDPASGQFQTSFRVFFTAYDVAPTSVRLAVDSAAGTDAYEAPATGSTADLAGVALAVATDPVNPTTNTITVQAMCGPDPCGPRIYTGIVADIEAPTYEFVRASLCGNGVPLVPAGCDQSAAIAGAGNPAIWNLARDADNDGGTGFDAQPFVVTTAGLEEGRTVRLITDIGSLTNATAPATGGSATFAQLIASHLPGSEVRRISVSFTDRAGNPATPAAGRTAAQESIYARTDVIAPRGVVADVCIGESTGTDAASREAGNCAAACAATGLCNRTAAAATLSWTAPGDDDGAGTVTSYFIGVAALGIDYGAGVLTNCADLGTTGYERLASLSTAPRAGGSIEHLGVDELYPHRDYCVVVAATDEVGNEGPRTVVARRKIPFVTVPTQQPFDGVVRDDAQAVGAFRSEPAAPQDYGAFATSLPDLDADGRDDFAVTQLTSGSVQLFLSASPGGAFVPAVTINAPAIAYSGSFGVAVAGGDFDGDGLNDLVICDPTLTTVGFPAAGARGGALFLYYGVAGAGIARTINTTTPQVPSLHPDVSLLGAAGQELCANAAFANTKLVATTGPTSNAARGFGIQGGNRARLPGGPSYFDVASAADEVLVVAAPQRLAVGDFDADGDIEAVIADQQRLHVFDGASLTATIDILPGSGFGNALATVHSPAGAVGDWLLVGTTDGRVVVLPVGFVSDPTNHAMLDNTDWSGTPAPRFGRTLASIGNFDGVGGTDIVVGPGTDASGPHATFVYSFDRDTGSFEKRAVLQGGAGFGSRLVGVRGYNPGSPLGRSQLLVVQRFAARLFMFR